LEAFADQRALTADAVIEQLEQQDAFTRTLEGLEPTLRTVVIGKLAGQTNAELADQLGCSTRTIERKLNLIRKIWTDAS
jgi:DNA-directed RNA polymerase specialized sigma24 family protein